MIGCMVPCIRRKHELSPPHFKGKPVTLPVWSSAQAPPGVASAICCDAEAEWCRSPIDVDNVRWYLLITAVFWIDRSWPHSCARPCNEILFGQVVRRYPGSTYVEACHRSTVSMLIGKKPVFSQVVQEPAVRSRPGLGHHARFHNKMKRFTRCIGTSVCHICCATSLTTYKIFFWGH